MALDKKITIYNYVLILFSLFVGLAISEDIMLNVNLKKPITVVNDKFLSITLDPVVLFNSDLINNIEKATSMAKALAPAYVRIGGPLSNSYIFERGLYSQEMQSDPSYTFSENHWIQMHQWAERSGLEVIACIAPQQFESNNARSSFWDPRNALDLMSFSDHMGYNTSWQLGYECQTRCDVSGGDLGRDVQRLRSMLDAFPRYAERGLIIGPDVVTYKSRQQQQYLQDYFNAASGSLSAITWHPDFASISLETEGVSIHYDNLALDKDSFYRAVGRHITKKPLWIAESRPEECKHQFLGALVWARRLGNSAKLGLQVLMRQPDNSNLFKPTPDYWVSILHKMLVGREVLDTKITTGNRTHVNFYCQCTNPSSKYEKGSLTVFGINLTPSKITASLKGIKLKIVHKYILLPGYDASNRMFSQTILLNNELLSLIDGKEVPDIQPTISSGEKGVKLKLPSGGIGFWVLPGLKVKSCMGHEDEIMDKNILRKINRRFEESEIDVESESEDENKREISDVISSVEERKPSLRLQRTTHKRLSLRRNSRHKEDERDDLEEKKSRKLDGAQRDFDRLQTIMRKKNHHTVNLKSGGNYGVFESSDEDNNGSSEEDVFPRTINGQKIDSGEVIRTKLQEYKKRLNDYKNSKRQRELINNLTKERIKDDLDDSINKGMDTEKVIEALTLISKVESAMKGLEKENEGEHQITSEIPTLETSDSNDVTAGLQQSINGSRRGDDVLLDEVLNTEKSKRTSIPTKIEDQLKALYRLLSEEKEKRDNQLSQRRRRDLDKRRGDDSLGQHPDNIFLRRRIKTEEAKERFNERVNERKQRLRERQELKHGKEEMMKESRNSNENNFYGFQHREPLKNFPQGDVYFQTEIASNERKNNNYEYLGGIDRNKQLHQQQLKRNCKRSNTYKDLDEDEDTWLEEGEVNHMPNEFYENLKLQEFNTKENLKDYRELWEAESIHKNKQIKKNSNEPTESTIHEIVTENSLTNSEDRQRKEKTIQQLFNYYKTNVNEKDYDFDELRDQQQLQYQPKIFQSTFLPNDEQNQTAININKHQDAQQNIYTDTNIYYLNPSAHVHDNKFLYHRTKRYTNDLEDLLRQEMITQDNNNLRDCQCRVIRGIEECKDCSINNKHIFKTVLVTTSDLEIKNHTNYIKKNRFQRELNEKTNINYPETPENSTLQIKKKEKITPKEQIEESTYALNKKINIKDCNETKEIIESATINMEDKLKLESNNDKKLCNRLPRKIEPSTKFLFKTGETLNIPISKVNPKSDLKNNGTIVNDFTNNIYTNIVNETETSTEHVAIIRSTNTETPQRSIESPLGKILDRTNFSKKQSSRYFDEKNSVVISEMERKTDLIVKNDNNEKIYIQNTNDQITLCPIMNNSMEMQSLKGTSLNTSTSKYINETNIDSRTKQKNNSTIKIDERIKSRQTRLTTRAEALAALRKENESRRAKKMIETSMKIIDIEKSKFAEYQKRRHDQLERLKRKLRAKRERMLKQYRNELLEAINENSESKESNIHRQDLLDKFQTIHDELGKNDMTPNSNKFGYLMNSKPIQYTTEKDADKLENGNNTPMFEIMEPYHQVIRRQVLPCNQVKTYIDNDNSEYKTNKDRKQKIPLEKKFYHASDEQEFGIKSKMKSPYSLIVRDATIENHNMKNFDDLKKNNNKYYMQTPQKQQQHQQTLEYYPHTIFNKDAVLPLHVQYSQQPLNTQQAHVNFYKINPSYIQNKYNNSFDKINSRNVQKMQDFNFYDMNQQNIQGAFDINNYYHMNQQITPNQQQLKQNIYSLNTPNYEETEKALLAQKYQNTKKSNLNIFEIDPSVYSDNTDYNSEELFITPLPQLFIRNFHKNPYSYINTRYKREAMLNKQGNEYEPLSFSLGLKKSKILETKNENVVLPDNLIRRKRVVNELYNIKKKIPLHNNMKEKVQETNFDKTYKKLTRSPRYMKRTKNVLELHTDSTNKHIYKKSKNLNDIPIKVKKLNTSNYLDKIKIKGLSLRPKRSLDQSYDYQIIESNGIDRLEDPKIDEIWKSIVGINLDDKILQEYNQQNNNKIQNVIEMQHNIKNQIEPIKKFSNNKKNLTIIKTIESTTQTDIATILVGAIPKFQTVITGELKKAENLKNSVEHLIDNFGNQVNGTTNYLKGNIEDTDTSKTNDEKINHNIFRTMVGSVKKFFGLVSEIAKIFHKH